MWDSADLAALWSAKVGEAEVSLRKLGNKTGSQCRDDGYHLCSTNKVTLSSFDLTFSLSLMHIFLTFSFILPREIGGCLVNIPPTDSWVMFLLRKKKGKKEVANPLCWRPRGRNDFPKVTFQKAYLSVKVKVHFPNTLTWPMRQIFKQIYVVPRAFPNHPRIFFSHNAPQHSHSVFTLLWDPLITNLVNNA